tara:strand:- start:557 stop:790 length:234 start_codon:yes stop_codon:yes gene_type:complete
MKPTKAQIIWYRDSNTDEASPLELRLPKVINSDIGFQLQFGPHESIPYWRHKINKHHEQSQDAVQVIEEKDINIKWI